MPGEFSELIKTLGLELETMAKADPVCDPKDDKGGKADVDGKEDDKKIQAAAEDGKKLGGDDDGKPMGKALTITMADGSSVEGVDATEMLKALELTVAEQGERIEDLQKAFSAAVEVIKTTHQQQAEATAMLKSFGTKLGEVRGGGEGRRTMVSIVEKLTPASNQPGGKIAKANEPTMGSVMMKAQHLRAEGKIGWDQIGRIEAYQNRGMLAPPELIAHFPQLTAVD